MVELLIATKTRADAGCSTDHELLQAKIKNTQNSKYIQKLDIQNISEEYKETVRNWILKEKTPRISGKGYKTQSKKHKRRKVLCGSPETLKDIEERRLKK